MPPIYGPPPAVERLHACRNSYRREHGLEGRVHVGVQRSTAMRGVSLPVPPRVYVSRKVELREFL